MRVLLIALCLTGALVTGCGRLRSVPYPTSRNSLDSEALDYLSAAPVVDLAEYADQGLRAGQRMPGRAVLVAASGGGARAAAFTLGVLAEMEEVGRWTSHGGALNALDEVDYFSTVSGGGWGVAAYLADRHFSGTGGPYRLNAGLEEIQRAFVAAPAEGRRCLSGTLRPIMGRGGQQLRFGDIFRSPGDAPPALPYLFVNAAVEGNQYPFLFTDAFADYYRVSSMTFCDEPVPLPNPGSVTDITVADAVATSGSVPGFYHTSATTRICEPGSNLTSSFFCSYGRGGYDELTLVDGGVYDNYGYQSAIEIMQSAGSGVERTVIVIDSNADTEIPFVRDGDRGALTVGAGTLFKAGFPARTAAYQRMFGMTAEAMGFQTVRLDFAVAAGLTDTTSASGRSYLEGLDHLRRHARTRINCFDDEGVYIEASSGRTNGDLPDCRENNFYRTGLMGKTTYQFDDYYFRLLVELGRLVVRLRADELYEGVYGPDVHSAPRP